MNAYLKIYRNSQDSRGKIQNLTKKNRVMNYLFGEWETRRMIRYILKSIATMTYHC